jgi:hypothetical protein
VRPRLPSSSRHLNLQGTSSAEALQRRISGRRSNKTPPSTRDTSVPVETAPGQRGKQTVEAGLDIPTLSHNRRTQFVGFSPDLANEEVQSRLGYAVSLHASVWANPLELTRNMTYGAVCKGTVGPIVTLPAADEMGMNLGVDVLSLSKGYVAWNSPSTPSTLTCICG